MPEVRSRKWTHLATVAAAALVAGAAIIPNLPEPPAKPTVTATPVHDDAHYRQYGIETAHRIDVKPDDTQITSSTYCLENASTGCVLKRRDEGVGLYEYVAVFSETVADISVEVSASPFTEIRYKWGTSLYAPTNAEEVRVSSGSALLLTVPSANVIHLIMASDNPIGQIYVTANVIQ